MSPLDLSLMPHSTPPRRPAVPSRKAADADDVAAAVDVHDRAARNGVDAVKRAKADQKRQRRAFAKAEVERLRRELDSLRMFGGANPKGTARRAAKIADNLAQNAQEYRSNRTPAVVDGVQFGPDRVTEMVTRTAEGLGHSDGIGADHRFAEKIRQVFSRAQGLLEQQRRLAAETHDDDREYTVLAARTRAAGTVLVSPAPDLPPLNLTI